MGELSVDLNLTEHVEINIVVIHDEFLGRKNASHAIRKLHERPLISLTIKDL